MSCHERPAVCFFDRKRFFGAPVVDTLSNESVHCPPGLATCNVSESQLPSCERPLYPQPHFAPKLIRMASTSYEVNFIKGSGDLLLDRPATVYIPVSAVVSPLPLFNDPLSDMTIDVNQRWQLLIVIASILQLMPVEGVLDLECFICMSAEIGKCRPSILDNPLQHHAWCTDHQKGALHLISCNLIERNLPAAATLSAFPHKNCPSCL